jgi:hypothetical protein
MNVVASRNVSHMRARTKTVAKRRRQNDDVDNRSHNARDLVDGIAPISYNFANKASVVCCLVSSRASSFFNAFVNFVTEPTNTLNRLNSSRSRK